MDKRIITTAVFGIALGLVGCDETNHNDIQSNGGDSHIHVEAGAHADSEKAPMNQSTARQQEPGSSEHGESLAQQQATTRSNTPTTNTSVGRQEHP